MSIAAVHNPNMASTLRGRPAHAPGPTFFSYTPNGRSLITAGLNTAIRVFTHGSDDEPVVVDVLTENHSACVATNEFFIIASEDGDVAKYSLSSKRLEEVLTRCASPVRDLALSPDGQWVAVASEELQVKVINTNDMSKVLYLQDHAKPIKHVAFDKSGTILAASGTDGVLFMYSLSSEQPQLLKRIEGVTKALRSDAEPSSRVVWHPDGRAFAVPGQSREIQIIARSDWQRQRSFPATHERDVTAAAWSPNGAFLATAGLDKTLILWDARSLKPLKVYDDLRDTIVQMHWHRRDNVLSYTNTNGELFMRDDFVPSEHRGLLQAEMHRAPLKNDPLSEVSGNARKSLLNGHKRPAEDDYLDDLLGPGPGPMSEDGDADDFIVDDDGAGYAEEPLEHRKRHGDELLGPARKRQAGWSAWQPRMHESFQPGSTPWQGNRRYLCLNLIGFIWTVNQETHHTVTVEFYDRQQHRDYHFTDPYLYDKACLDEKGSLFSCPPSDNHPAMLHYRPHETWTTRADWRTQLPEGEEVTSLSLSQSCIVATTSAGYVRVYSLFGLPLKIYRQKSTPAVSCASWRDYVLTIGNGPVSGDGRSRLLYTIENVRHEEVYQSEDILALPDDVDLRSVLFSDKGDPYIYDSEGVLLVLQHWRTAGQAKWVPVLDTRTLDRLASGKKEEKHWPVAIANNVFHCIILKGGAEYPYFPRPLLSEFELRIPLSATEEGDETNKDDTDQKSFEEQYVRNSLLHSLLADTVEHTHATTAQKADVSVLEREVDKTLLQLLAIECREGEERGMKALELAALMRDRSGKMLEAAGKIATRFQRDILGEKIMQLAERRLVGLADDGEL